MDLFEILLLIVGLIIGIFATYFYFKTRVNELARPVAKEMFEQQKNELEKLFEGKYLTELEKWKAEWEEKFRQDALERSRAVLKGKIAEQLAPIFAVFGHDPSDARFIGSPIDYVIFDNYTKRKDGGSNEPITVILADIKTGESAVLTKEQKEIKKAVQEGRIKWETIDLKKKLE